MCVCACVRACVCAHVMCSSVVHDHGCVDEFVVLFLVSHLQIGPPAKIVPL